MRRSFWLVMFCFSLWQVVALAQSSDHDRNLSACKSGSVACDHAQLTQSETSAVAAAEHQRNFKTDAQIRGVDMGQLLAAFRSAHGKMTGTMEGDLMLAGEIEHT